ncbi:DUF47 family protein [Thermogladius sp. KZ2Tp1]|uniref:DUF47 domain-containing protein n=1 Tax=unclassified Thermogladius TaxID=2647734 RepID=UPI003D1366AD
MPAETSIAEMNSIDYLTMMVRDVEDVLAVLEEAVKAYAGGNSVSRVYPKIRDLKNKVEEGKVLILEYLMRLGEALMNARSYIAVAQGLDKIAQLSDGAGYRLMLLEENNIRLDNKIVDSVVELVKTARKQMLLVRDSLEKLRLNPRKSLSNCSEVSKLEALADETYRNTTFSLYTLHSGNIVALMVGKEIVDFVEDICDFAKLIGEEIRFLALLKTAST